MTCQNQRWSQDYEQKSWLGWYHCREINLWVENIWAVVCFVPMRRNSVLDGFRSNLLEFIQESRTEHVTPLLRELHWLRYPDRIDYKLAVLVYRCLHGLAPSYLADEFTRVSEIVSRRNLRSASTANLVVPRFQRTTLGGRAFPVAAAQAWNSLPSHVTSSSTLASFKRNLKTELFLRSYVQAWYRLMLHVLFLTLLRALEVNIDLRHVNHISLLFIII